MTRMAWDRRSSASEEIADVEAGLERGDRVVGVRGVLGHALRGRRGQRTARREPDDHLFLVEAGGGGDLVRRGRPPALCSDSVGRGLDSRGQLAARARYVHRSRPTEHRQHLADRERRGVAREGRASARVVPRERREQADDPSLLEILTRRPALEAPCESRQHRHQALDERGASLGIAARGPDGKRVGRLRHRG